MTARDDNRDRSEPLFATAMRETFASGYTAARLRGDVVAGITLGVIALPLGMALAIAAGVPPQYGLYTVIVGGLIIAATGGSRFNVSGPTAAFVAILLPIVAQYGLGGLLVATVLSGIILVALGVTRLGKVIEFIPYPVVVGFTAGIGVVIATLQLRDFLGLDVVLDQAHFLDKVAALAGALPGVRWEDLLVGGVTLACMLLWPKLNSRVPAHLVSLVVGTLLAMLLARWLAGFEVATVGSRFTWVSDDALGHGIPPLPPHFVLPWAFPGPDGQPLGISMELVRELLPAAFAIALLGAIESLLCAVVADGFAGTRHNPNSELIGQGLGNIVAPFFGGITATAAIARTAVNVRVGASSPVAAMVHALTVLLIVVLAAELLSYVPMAALAALLLVVAWNMAEARHFVHIVHVAPRSDVAVLLTCFVLTVVFDMVLAVGVGVALAAALFIRRMVDLTGAELLAGGAQSERTDLPAGVAVYDINGPLFFGAARQALDNIRLLDSSLQVVVLDMNDVNVVDMTGLVAFTSTLDRLRARGLTVIVSGLLPRIHQKLQRAGVQDDGGRVRFAATLDDALQVAARLVTPAG